MFKYGDTQTRLLEILSTGGLLTDDNRELVVNHKRSYALASALSHMQEAGIFSQTTFVVLAMHEHTSDLAISLSKLQRAGILNKKNFMLLASHESSSVMSQSLNHLYRARLLTQIQFTILIHHTHPDAWVRLLCGLHELGILSKEIQAILVQHPKLDEVELAFFKLKDQEILSKKMFMRLAKQSHPRNVYRVLLSLQASELLTKEHVYALMQDSHAVLLSFEARPWVWAKIPRYLLTKESFQRLLIAAEQSNPLEAVKMETRHILRVKHPFVPSTPRSIGNPSIAPWVSESAKRLMATYNGHFDFEVVIRDLLKLGYRLGSGPKYTAAQRCIERLAAADGSFMDRSSNISIRQLLALVYIAIQDNKRRIVTLHHALHIWVEALYEIQRGYNIEQGDAWEESGDLPISMAGAYNMLIEKLVGVHPHIEQKVNPKEEMSLTPAHRMTTLL